jgi:hypothetical protein
MQRINLASPRFEYDSDDPEGFRSGMTRLGKLFGGSAQESGITVPSGPEAAHGIRNETEETARVLMFSTVVVRRESKVDYFDGEG